MAALLKEMSTIAAAGQTTIPESVHQALGVDDSGQIAFRVDKRGITLSRADENEEPAIGAFINFLVSTFRGVPKPSCHCRQRWPHASPRSRSRMIQKRKLTEMSRFELQIMAHD